MLHNDVSIGKGDNILCYSQSGSSDKDGIDSDESLKFLYGPECDCEKGVHGGAHAGEGVQVCPSLNMQDKTLWGLSIDVCLVFLM